MYSIGSDRNHFAMLDSSGELCTRCSVVKCVDLVRAFAELNCCRCLVPSQYTVMYDKY